ncbi:hypothetical protein NPIL_144731 [Nephila pilipes]|uniref:Uncharacterized protein n=1 Tax=Nephila pilipes TaxID=299642 RepID=A0A8X6PMP3_NEPPI|nr:hypothetical protein NPIL_144731 [Nephila pilipes]
MSPNDNLVAFETTLPSINTLKPATEKSENSEIRAAPSLQQSLQLLFAINIRMCPLINSTVISSRVALHYRERRQTLQLHDNSTSRYIWGLIGFIWFDEVPIDVSTDMGKNPSSAVKINYGLKHCRSISSIVGQWASIFDVRPIKIKEEKISPPSPVCTSPVEMEPEDRSRDSFPGKEGEEKQEKRE